MAANIAAFDAGHACQLLEHRFGAPKAATGKYRCFVRHGRFLLVDRYRAAFYFRRRAPPASTWPV